MRNRTLKEIQEDIRTLTRVPSEFIHAKLDELAKEIEELVDQEGNGTFRSSDGNIPYASIGIYVNAWMSLPKPYKGE